MVIQLEFGPCASGKLFLVPAHPSFTVRLLLELPLGLG
jgi:hypothetical protein